jgi:hypothetical protein
LPSNIGISDYARAFMPATFDALEKEQPGVTDTVKSIVVEMLLAPTAVEEDLSAFVAGYVGKALAVALIPAGIDHWAVNSRVTRGISRPAGVIGGNENATNYDRVSALDKLKKQLEAELERDLPRFLEDGDSNATPSQLGRGIRVSTDGQPLRTEDPRDMPSIPIRAKQYSWLNGVLDWYSGN